MTSFATTSATNGLRTVTFPQLVDGCRVRRGGHAPISGSGGSNTHHIQAGTQPAGSRPPGRGSRLYGAAAKIRRNGHSRRRGSLTRAAPRARARPVRLA